MHRAYCCWARALLFAITGFFCVAYAQASVVVTGTRVIYNGQDREKTLQLTNQDSFPNIVQAWVDVDNSASTPGTADAPFVINPTVSKLSPGAGQALRIIYTGGALPEDRESIFYLNILQIPPRNLSNSDKNQMLLMLRNRLKLFYRPASIAGKQEDLQKKLQFRLIRKNLKWHIRVENPTSFYASFGSAKVHAGNQVFSLKVSMVSPYSSADWVAENTVSLPSGALELHAQLINDYGARIELTHENLD